VITAVDSSVLIDIFGADEKFGLQSAEAMRVCLSEGAVIACEVVWTKTAVVFDRDHDFVEAMGKLGVQFSAIEQKTATSSARAWRKYLARGGRRERVAERGTLRDVPLIVLSAGNASPEQRAEHESLGRCFQGRIEIVPGSGHWLQLDRPDVVIRAINEIIAQVRGR